MEKTCGNCIFKGDSFEEDPNSPYFKCNKIKHGISASYHKTYGERDQIAINDQMKTAAFTVDGSDYYAALCVSKDFGCNQWMKQVSEW